MRVQPKYLSKGKIITQTVNPRPPTPPPSKKLELQIPMILVKSVLVCLNWKFYPDALGLAYHFII